MEELGYITFLGVLPHYPFGMLMPGRQWSSGSEYRFGFGGQEQVDKVYGNGNSYTAEFWQYDPRLGRRWNLDPVPFSWQSSYSTFNNNPILYNDPFGLYGSEKRAERAARRYSRNHDLAETPDVYQVAKEWGFNTIPKEGPGAEWHDGVNRKAYDNATPFQVGQEWLTGQGPLEHHFFNGDPFTELLKTHEHIEETRKLIANRIATGGKLEDNNDYNLGGLEGVPKYMRDYSTLATAGQTGNLAVTYLGSFSLTYKVTAVDVEKKVATVEFMVSNRSSISSATHPPLIGYTQWWSKYIGTPLNNYLQVGPMSETYQDFKWTETINMK
ncbi:MAG: hypothetical protein IPH61_16255 [Bacteroidetes bacterium]|nr:hypothetical protein [Bacteroidota bacterium]